MWWHVLRIPVLGEWRQVDPWDSLDGQPRQSSRLQASETPASKEGGGGLGGVGVAGSRRGGEGKKKQRQTEVDDT